MGKKTGILAAVLLLVFGTLCGCGNFAVSEKAQIEIKNIPNQIDEWKEELSRNTELGKFDAKSIRGLEVIRNNEVVFAVSYEPRDYKESYDYWDISVPYHSLVSVNTETLYESFSALAAIMWKETMDVSFEEAGLRETNNILFICYNDEAQPEPDKGVEILIGNEDGNGSYYAGVSGSEKVYLANKILIDSILQIDSFDCILKIPALVNIQTISQVNILMDEKEYSFIKEDEDWNLDGRQIGKEDFQPYYGKLLDILIAEELPENAALAADRTPVLILQFLRKAEDVSDIEIRYYLYDDKYMSVNVNGQEQFLVEKRSVEELLENIPKVFQNQ